MVINKIAQLVINLKNANKAGKTSISMRHSNYAEAILETLKKAGYISSYSVKGKIPSKTLEIELSYVDGKPRIEGVQQMSQHSRRVYTGYKEVKPVRNGFGLLILSTPSGIMTDREAKKQKVGGETLFKIW
jgi:small subunit ribosomal protein S8